MNVTNRAIALGVTRATVKLYKTGRYRRHGALLAENLVRTGLDAGAYIDMIDRYGDVSDRAIATDRALRELDKLAYVAYVMQAEGIYPEGDVARLLKVAREAKDRLEKQLKDMTPPEQPRAVIRGDASGADGTPFVTVDDGVQLEMSDIAAVDAAEPEPAPAAAEYAEDDGFNDEA